VAGSCPAARRIGNPAVCCQESPIEHQYEPQASHQVVGVIVESPQLLTRPGSGTEPAPTAAVPVGRLVERSQGTSIGARLDVQVGLKALPLLETDPGYGAPILGVSQPECTASQEVRWTFCTQSRFGPSGHT
jgi:hypothetical protein